MFAGGRSLGGIRHHFVTLAKTLVAAHEENAILRLGWEFDGGIFAWSATTPGAEASYATYFRRIVTSMSVAGERFKFVWNPDAAAFNDGPYDVTAAYPGNAYVDYIGLDAYDESTITPRTGYTAWRETTLPDLKLAQKFAATEGKPLAIPEWGVAMTRSGEGLGDDPVYINKFLDWMKAPANDVVYLEAFTADLGHPGHPNGQSTWPTWATAAGYSSWPADWGYKESVEVADDVRSP